MSHTLGTYSFLPFLRNGIASLINSPDAASSVALRAALHVELTLAATGGDDSNPSQPFARDVLLYGPGDIVGIDKRGIVRTEPRHWSTNVEPNYLAHIEFYDEDFPWRYTPASASGERLRPWITLVVLADGEFNDDLNPDAPRPRNPEDHLSSRITFDDPNQLASRFPPADQLWAWAHVHVNRSLTQSDNEVASSNMAAVMAKLHGFIDPDPDLAFSRLICPRKLGPDTRYHAFLVPSFESGRLAALGLDPTKAPSATHSAWAAYSQKGAPQAMPYYHRWLFRTGGPGDFESLVRLLEAKPVDSRVGTRDMDVQSAGSNLPPTGLSGILKLGGALKVPPENYDKDEKKLFDLNEKWDQPYPQPFQTELAKLINLSDDYLTKKGVGCAAPGAVATGDEDPIIAPPLYGTWHSLTKRLLVDKNDRPVPNRAGWVHRLNLDPRFRAAAGFGTRVIQQNQEQYMDAAWGQVGDVLEANRQIRISQLAKHLSFVLYQKHLLPVERTDPGRALLMTSPVLSRVVADGVTLRHRMNQSFIQPSVTSIVTRRALRSGGRARRLMPTTPVTQGAFVARVAAGTLRAAPARSSLAGAITLAKLSSKIAIGSRPEALLEAIELHAGTRRATSLTPLGRSPNFKVVTGGQITSPTFGNTDSAEAARFKTAVREAHAMVDRSFASVPKVTRSTLNISSMAHTAIEALDPRRTIRARLFDRVKLPADILREIGNDLVEVLAYPVIDDPMYKPLTDLSPDLLLPHINLIPPNSITLLNTNQPFIEAYMMGLNHEFARELLWREYPTDQRGSTFRQFWDATESIAAATGDQQDAKESVRDIKKIHEWSSPSMLGTHSNRQSASTDLVLVIRGELLKRYPTAVVYAHRADWQLNGGQIDPSLGRRLVNIPNNEEDNPPREKIRTPLYEAKVDPDIYFFGFDLTAKEVKGESGEPGHTNPGWFFVIRERPGEPRFGLDSEKQPSIRVWNDLSWTDVQPGATGSYIQMTASTASIPLAAVSSSDPLKDQHADDVAVTWGPSMSSADLAYVLFQAPVMIAVHGAEMLRSAGDEAGHA
jgi:hypothetical protein